MKKTAILLFSMLLLAPSAMGQFWKKKEKKETTPAPMPVNVDSNQFRVDQVMGLINSNYVDGPDMNKMSETAINAMLPYMGEIYGNPSSLYTLGQQAKEILMKQLHITEPEAHHLLQKQAMDHSTKMADYAARIVQQNSKKQG